MTVVGNITIHPEIVLKDVLYVKGFKYNLLSVSKLLEDSDLVALFTQKGFLVQGLLLRGLWLMAIKNQGFIG